MNKIKTTINVFVNEKFELKNDRLFVFDWMTLAKMKKILKFFFEIIKFIEDREFTINKILFVFDFLMHKFETKILLHDSNLIMTFSIDANYKKFEKYWNRIVVQVFIYIVAIILNFEYKWNYFQYWNAIELIQIKNALQTLWSKYKNYSISISNVDITNFNNEMFEFLQWMHKNQFIVVHRDELQQYFMKSRMKNLDNIIDYWKN